jgi:AraC-like DNA-binding protein
LVDAETLEAKFHLLETFLVAKAARPLEQHPVICFALDALQCTQKVGDVARQIGLSQRRFIQIFQEEVGLMPKLFVRIQRFQSALRLIGQEQEWTNIALRSGYFDQAHFIHDFRTFSGITPTTYLAQWPEHLNHVPLQT